MESIGNKIKINKLLKGIKILQDDEEDSCLFCDEPQHINFFHQIIKEALFEKYPSS